MKHKMIHTGEKPYKYCVCGNTQVSLCRIYCRIRTNWPFEFVQVIIPGHSINDNDNDNRFEQCSSLSCVWLRKVSTKDLIIFKIFPYPARIIFIPAYAHWECVVIVFVAQHTCCILVILTLYYVIHGCNISQENSVK